MEDVFEFKAANFDQDDFRVVSFNGTEVLAGPYRFDLELTCSADGDLIDGVESKLLGQSATFAMNGAERAYRVTKGYVSAVKTSGISRHGRAHLSVTLVPKLEFLKLNKKSRIFQDMTVREIV